MPGLPRVEMASSDLTAIHHGPDSNAGTYININEILRELPHAPDTLGSGSALDIVVDAARNAVDLRDLLGKFNRMGPVRVNLKPDPFIGIDTADQTDAHRDRLLADPSHGANVVIKR